MAALEIPAAAQKNGVPMPRAHPLILLLTAMLLTSPLSGAVGGYAGPDERRPFATISELNKRNEAGVFNTEGYVAYVAPDSRCGQDCAGGPTSYIVISESRRAFRRPSFRCSNNELVVNFPTDVPVWNLFRLGRKYRFTLNIIRLGPRDAVIYHYSVLPRPKIVADPVGIGEAGAR